MGLLEGVGSARKRRVLTQLRTTLVLKCLSHAGPDSAGSQLSAIAAAESAALTRDLVIASEDDVRLPLQQETNGREPAAPCTGFPTRLRNRPNSPRRRPFDARP